MGDFLATSDACRRRAPSTFEKESAVYHPSIDLLTVKKKKKKNSILSYWTLFCELLQ